MKKFMLSLVLLFGVSVSAQACAGYFAGYYSPPATFLLPVTTQSYVYPAPVLSSGYAPADPVVGAYASPILAFAQNYNYAYRDYSAFRGYYRSRQNIVVFNKVRGIRSAPVTITEFRGRDLRQRADVRVEVRGGRAVIRSRR